MENRFDPRRLEMSASIARALAIADELEEWLVGAHLASAQAAVGGEQNTPSLDDIHRAIEAVESMLGPRLTE